MKKPQIILLVLVLIIVGAMMAKNLIIHSAITTVVPQVLGTPIRISSLEVGIFRPVIHMKGIKLYNPPGFPNEPFVDIQEVKVEYDLGAILKKNLHVPLIILKLNEVVMVKDKDGKLNFDSLKIAQQKTPQDKTQKKGAPAKPSPEMPMQIDVLQLDLGKVVVKDFSKGGAADILVYDAGVHNKTYKNIRSAQALATLVLMEAMGPTGMKAAGIYGAATVLGVAFLPAGVAGILIGKDSGSGEFKADFDRAFQAAKEILLKQGKISAENKDAGTLKAKIDGADVQVAIVKTEANKVVVTVSARKYLIPKAEVAQGVLYQIGERLK